MLRGENGRRGFGGHDIVIERKAGGAAAGHAREAATRAALERHQRRRDQGSASDGAGREIVATGAHQLCQRAGIGGRSGEARGRRERAASTREDRRRIKELERELRRKEKALAETAALLVLSKKVAAIFNKGEDE